MLNHTNSQATDDPMILANTPHYTPVDITELVRAWVNGTAPNYGLMLVGLDNNDETRYAGRESGSGAYLEVVTAPPTALGAVWASDMSWIDEAALASSGLTWSNGAMM